MSMLACLQHCVRVYFSTYGCTMNQGDTEVLRALVARRHQVVDSPEKCDAVVVNSCAVVETTERKVLKEVRHHKRCGRRVVLAGCLAAANPEAAAAAGADAVLPPARLAQVEEVLEGKPAAACAPAVRPELPKLRHGDSAIAIVAISEGCLGRCSYCITKRARGRLRSFHPESIRREVEQALEQGYREIQLTSQDTAVYGRDIGTSLPELLGTLTDIEGEFRIRVGMMNPAYAGEVFDELLKAYESRKVYRFLHMPVQSGSNEVLEHMRRGYRVEDFVELAEEFRRRFPESTLSTDVIVGYPTEGEREFELTRRLIEELKPEILNITRFSPRPGTEAARLRPLRGGVVKERSRRLTSLMRRIALERNRRYLGRSMEVLVTKHGKKGTLLARNSAYRQVVLGMGSAELGDFLRVRVSRVSHTCLFAHEA